MDEVNGMRDKTVLIVEDDEDTVQDLLVSWKPRWLVRHVSSGEEAVAAIREHSPDLILLDLSLPHYLAEVDGEEGLRILSWLRRDLRLRTPVVVITGDTLPATRLRADSLGADDFLVKPLNVEELDKSVARLMGSSDGGDERKTGNRNA